MADLTVSVVGMSARRRDEDDDYYLNADEHKPSPSGFNAIAKAALKKLKNQKLTVELTRAENGEYLVKNLTPSSNPGGPRMERGDQFS